MERKDVIVLCHYYNGEDEDKCPFTDRIKAQLWAAEMMACTYLISMISDENPKDDLHKAVFAYVSKWNPYEYRKALDEYIKTANPKKEIIKAYYS